jgi:hypothetical protein
MVEIENVRMDLHLAKLETLLPEFDSFKRAKVCPSLSLLKSRIEYRQCTVPASHTRVQRISDRKMAAENTRPNRSRGRASLSTADEGKAQLQTPQKPLRQVLLGCSVLSRRITPTLHSCNTCKPSETPTSGFKVPPTYHSMGKCGVEREVPKWV